MHLLSGESDHGADNAETAGPAPLPDDIDRLARLEAEIQSLKDDLADLGAAFNSFRKQFE